MEDVRIPLFHLAILHSHAGVEEALQSRHDEIEEDAYALRHARGSQKDGVNLFFIGLDHIGEHFHETAGGQIGPYMIVTHAGKPNAGQNNPA